MALKKKLTPAAHAATMQKAISSAQDNAMKAFSDWGKSTQKAVTTTEKNLAAAAKKVGSLQIRASKALKRVQKAKAKQVKAIANDARKLVQAELATARSILKSARVILLNLIGAAFACTASVLLDYWPFIILEGIWALVSLYALLKYKAT